MDLLNFRLGAVVFESGELIIAGCLGESGAFKPLFDSLRGRESLVGITAAIYWLSRIKSMIVNLKTENSLTFMASSASF